MTTGSTDTAAAEVFPVPIGAPPAPAEVREPAGRPLGRAALLLLGVGLILIGLNLRIGVAAIGPVIGEIRASLGLSATVVSLLTTIPVFVFGAFAFLTPGLTRRLGMHRLLGIVLLVLAAGNLLRHEPSMTALFAGTVLVGIAIAVGNVVMPAAIKQDFAHRAGLMMGLYTMSLFVGAAFASGLTAPLLPVLGGSWRSALAIWALPAGLALLVWLPQLPRSPGRSTRRPILTDPTAIAVTGFMGLQSVSYYTTVTWVPTILQDAGMEVTAAGGMIAFSAFPAALAALLAPALAARMRPTWLPPVVAVLLLGAAYLGLIIAPASGAVAWMTVLGLGLGAPISLSLTYIVRRSPTTHRTGQLATVSQGFGYLVAGFGPLGIGALHAAADSWAVPLIVLCVVLVGQLVAGVVASRPVFIRVRGAREIEAA